MSNFFKDHLPASIVSQIFEEEPEPRKQATVPPAPQFTPPAPMAATINLTQPGYPIDVQTNVGYQSVPTVVGELADRSDDAYQRLLAKSDFTQTPVYQALNKYLAPLSGTGMDDKMKFGVALKQAMAIDHLDPTSVLSTFDKFNDDLTAAANNFSQAVTNKMHVEVDQKNAQATELQNQAKQLTEEAFATQQKIQQNQHRFEIALKTRQDELAQEKAKYASFLA